jgi:hypothetical protein
MQMHSLPQKERIAIGMERRRAATLLRTAGARATQLDGIPPPRGAQHAGVAYETRAGGLLVVDYVRPSPGHAYQVASLRHCRDPDLPKAKRVRQELSELGV